MYEKFTDRARKVMQLANQEAQRFNHEYIGTEHILLGLIREGTGVAANVLTNMKVDLGQVRKEVESLVQRGPEMVTMGKLPQTPRAKKCIEYSMEEARSLCHSFVGTEHVLLGLLREQEGVAAQVLMNMGVQIDEARECVLDLLGRGNQESVIDGISSSPGEVKRLTRAQHQTDKRAKVKEGDKLSLWSRSLTEASTFQDKDQRQPLDESSFRKIVHALLRRRKNNVLLVGDAMLTREYAQMFGHVSRHGPMPKPLLDIDVREFLPSAGNMQASLPSRIMHCLNECVQQGNVVLIIDQIGDTFQTRVEPGKENLGVLTRPWLRVSNVRCVGLIEDDDFEGKLAMDRHAFDDFTIIKLPPFNIEQINWAVVARLNELEEHHICTFAEIAVKKAIRAAMHYAPKTFVPEEVEQLLDHAAAILRSEVTFDSDEILNMETKLRRIIRSKSAAIAAGDYEKAFSKEERFRIQRKARIGLGKLPQVTAEQVFRSVAEVYGRDVLTVQKELD